MTASAITRRTADAKIGSIAKTAIERSPRLTIANNAIAPPTIMATIPNNATGTVRKSAAAISIVPSHVRRTPPTTMRTDMVPRCVEERKRKRR